MTGNRANWALRCLLVGTTALWLACDKGGGISGGGKLEGAASAATDILPKETGLVFGFSWSSFKDSAFYPMVTSALPKESTDVLKQVKDTCGIDALSDLKSIVIGGGGNLDQSRLLILVNGNWNDDKLTKCATAMGPKMGKEVTTAKDGNITTFTAKGEPPAHVGWVGDTMVITPTAMEGDKTYLTDMLKPKASVKDNKAFMDLFGKVDTSSTLYGAVLPPPDSDMAKAVQQMTGGQEKLAGAWMSLKVTKRLDAAIGLRMASDADAKSVTDKLNQQLEGMRKNPQAGEFLKAASVTQSGTDVNVKLALDEAQLSKLMDMMKNMMPMIMNMIH